MALWDSTSLNTNYLAKLWNQLWVDGYSMDIVRKHNGLLYMVMGKKTQHANGSFSFQNTENVQGNKVEIQFLGQLDTMSTVANGSAEVAAATATYNNNNYGAVEFDVCHYFHKPAIPGSEWVKMRGNEVKGMNYFKEEFRRLSLGIENQLGTAINSSTAVSNYNTTVGCWPHLASDGTSSGESGYDAYGTLTRSANTDFQSVVTTGVGTLGLSHLSTNILNVAAKGHGSPDCGVAGVTVYNAIWNLVASYSHIINDSKMMDFAGQFVKFGSVNYILEQRAPTGVLGHLNSANWKLWLNRNEVFDKETFWKRDPGLKSAYSCPFDVFAQFLCNNTGNQGKLTGITG